MELIRSQFEDSPNERLSFKLNTPYFVSEKHCSRFGRYEFDGKAYYIYITHKNENMIEHLETSV